VFRSSENEAEAVSAKLIETKEDSNREAVHDALAAVREVTHRSSNSSCFAT